MAIKWMTWAFDQDCSPTEKLVLLAIADCANADGEAYPSQSEISEKTSLHKSSIVRALQFLQEKKLLSKIHRTKKMAAAQVTFIGCILQLLNRAKFAQ